MVRGYVADSKKLPTTSQIQSFAKNNGKSIAYSVVGPLLKTFRDSLLNAALQTEVTVADGSLVETQGTLRKWSEKNESWSLDIWTADLKRYNFTSSKQPSIEVSEECAAWLR